MSTTSKSPRKVALVALRVATDAMPAYAHRFSPKTYTQHQLFACLVLKALFRTDYRGITAMLEEMPGLCRTLGLRRVPHFTTLQKACRRMLLSATANRLLGATVRKAARHVKLAAVDSSGFESRHISRYFVRRRSREPGLWQTTTYTRFPKLGIVCDCSNHLILSTLLARGPSPDVNQLRQTLKPATRRVSIGTLVADAGYDSESNHVFGREACGIRTIIPPKAGRPSARGPTGRYRREMAERFDKATYGQRWQVETVFSMIKHNLGSALHGRTYWSQSRDMMLLVLTHNIMILRRATELFYRAGQASFVAGPRKSSASEFRQAFWVLGSGQAIKVAFPRPAGSRSTTRLPSRSTGSRTP